MKRKDDTPVYNARHAAGEPTVNEQPTTTEFPSLGGGEEPVTVCDLIPPMEEKQPERKKRGLFRRRRAAEEPLLTEQPEETTVLEAAPPAVSDDTREIALGNEEVEKTQVIELAEEGGSHLVTEDDKATQLMLEGFAPEEETTVEVAPEEELRRIRQEKIQDFSQRREQLKREVAEAEQAATEEPVTVEPMAEEDAAEDIPVQETLETVPIAERQHMLKAQLHRSGITLLLTVFLEVILFFTAVFSAASPAIAMEPMSYLVLHLVLFGVLLVVGWKEWGAGLKALFTKRQLTAEGVVAAASLLTVVHTALLGLNTSGVADGSCPLLTGVAGVGLLVLQITHRLELTRQSRDLAVIAAAGDKLAVRRITDGATAEEIGRPAVALGTPRVAYFRHTETVEGYAENGQGFDPSAGFLRWYVPVTVGVSLLAALTYLLLNGFTAWIFAVTLFCSMVLVSAPVAVLLSLRATLFAAGKRARRHRTVTAGYHAVETYGAMHAVALDAMDLFPESSVLLHGIKTFSGTRIDEAILDAASVSVRAGGPLSHAFRRMIVGKVDMLHEVDTLVYEQDMGLSGWISGRRILIGNRKLLDNHGIDIPSRDYEERYAKNGRQLVYLSIAGELSAMFVISYTADPVVKQVLKSLTERKITLLVRTCDQNISEALLTSVFELDGFYVELLGAPAGRSFESLVSGVSACEPADIVSDGGMLGALVALTQCRRLRGGVRLFAVLQALVGLTGLTLVAVAALLGGTVFPPLYAIEYLGAASLLLSLVSLLFAKG